MVRWQEILQRKEAENSAFTLTLNQGLAHGEEKYVHIWFIFQLIISLFTFVSIIKNSPSKQADFKESAFMTAFGKDLHSLALTQL